MEAGREFREFEDEDGVSWASYQDYFVEKYLSGAGAYDGEIADDAINILRYLANNTENTYYTDIAKALGLDPKYVAVFLDLLGDSGLTEYGTAPRASWVTPEGREQLKRLDDATLS